MMKRAVLLGKNEQRREGLRRRSGRYGGQEENGGEQAPGQGLEFILPCHPTRGF